VKEEAVEGGEEAYVGGESEAPGEGKLGGRAPVPLLVGD
jgi:hypothetical protein